MVFPVDRFMQVKCKLQLTSESDSADSVHSTNGEKIRLCTSMEIDRNASIIAMICSNDTSNNHILVYYGERRQHLNSVKHCKPKIIVKQVFYHEYNEDIVALCLGDAGNKLILVSATTTIYIIPIKNILLNLHAQQLRSSQGKSMYFYDASIVDCCKSIENTTSAALWRKTTLILADKCGKLCFIDIDDKKELYTTCLRSEQIQSIYIVQDNLILKCFSTNQYRFSLELLGTNFTPEFHKLPRLFYHPATNLVSVIDVLSGGTINIGRTGLGNSNQEAQKLLRFYTSRQFFHRPQKPQLVCKMPNLMNKEVITHVVLTDRFIAIATDADRCLINSKNCCDLKYLQSSANATIEMDPLVKEITFNHDEKILLLIKSPIPNDLDNIIDSFLLVTNRSIYCIEARYSCREMYINLIDSHLGIDLQREAATFGQLKSLSINPDTIVTNNALIDTFLCYRDDLYEKICFDSQTFSLLFKLDLNSIYEAYGDRSLQRCQFQLANRFFQMAKFGHAKILNKYLRVGAYKQTIDYITNLLGNENEILEEKERIDLSRAAFDCLLAKTIVERSKILLYNTKMNRNQLRKLIEYHEQTQIDQTNRTSSSLATAARSSMFAPRHRAHQAHNNSGHSPRGGGDYRLLSNTFSGSFDLFTLCGHSPRVQDAKLSATTIVAEDYQELEDEEATLTSNTNTSESSSQSARNTLSCGNLRTAFTCDKRHHINRFGNLVTPKSGKRLECERALVDFIMNLMHGSLYSYAILHLVDFNLIELVEVIANRSPMRIYSLLKILARERDEYRLVFRDGRNESLLERLVRFGYRDLTKVDTSKREFLEFLTSPEVTSVLVKDISLTSEFYGYQHTQIQFRKFSFAAMRHLETYKKLILMTNQTTAKVFASLLSPNDDGARIHKQNFNFDDDDNAHDGGEFFKHQQQQQQQQQHRQLAGSEFSDDRQLAQLIESRLVLTDAQKRTIHEIFTQFLESCLNESTEDSCRLWKNYVQFYLNSVGTVRDLEEDILDLIDNRTDCRMAVTLFKAIYRDECNNSESQKDSTNPSTNSRVNQINGFYDDGRVTNSSDIINHNQESHLSMRYHNLYGLFENEFLVHLLEKTLDLLPRVTDLDALSVATMC